MIYLLYSPRMQGWLTKAFTYSSDANDAKTFDRDEALAMKLKHKTDAGYNLLPVRQEDLV